MVESAVPLCYVGGSAAHSFIRNCSPIRCIMSATVHPVRQAVFILAGAVALIDTGALLFSADSPAPNKWEKAIKAFEEEDAKQLPQPGGVLFLGSSSIRLWDLGNSFPDVKAVNRGFGGSQIADSVQFAERIVVPHQPRLVVFYAGDNDIAAGKSAEQVATDFKALVGRIHAKLPKTRIAFIAIKPCPSRWKFYETQKQANKLVEEFTKTDSRLAYIDVVRPMLNAEGKPREELFRKDNLHLNDEGYKVWNEIVKPHLAQK